MRRSRVHLSTSMALLTLVASVALVVSWFGVTTEAHATPASKVYLNGVPYPVFFNDGDSFRVLGGPLKGSKARLAGFNTLESYGTTHSWGDWTSRELYHNAKMGTYNGRRGPCWDSVTKTYRKGCDKAWHCTSDMKRDGYGRILWWCPDLAEDQIRKGIAHVMSVNGPGVAMLVKAQQDAIKHRRGMWSHGVPKYVITSLHSADEPWFRGLPYNRMVATSNGASRKWRHRRTYQECDKVCWWEVKLTPAALSLGVTALRADGTLAAFIGEYDDTRLKALLEAYRLNGDIGLALSKKHMVPLDEALKRLVKQGSMTILSKTKGACMVHAPFNRRYGPRSAACLH